MSNLFWKRNTGIKALLETPFRSEEEFEKTVFATSELLDDVSLIKRQVRGGAKPGIPDIIGIDSDGNVCILEMKNVPVDAGIIPQVLQYAIWAETNPDSIKALWLEHDEKPEDVEIDWDDYEVRILVIAPSIHRTTLEFVEKINYPVDLIEVKRWVEGENQFLMVNRLEPEQKKPKVKITRGLPDYDEAFFERHYNKASVADFLRNAKEITELINRNGWELETKFTRNACVFKAGFFNAFALRWIGRQTFALSFKVPQREVQSVNVSVTRWNKKRTRAYFYVDPKKTNINDFEPLFNYCYRQLAGDLMDAPA